MDWGGVDLLFSNMESNQPEVANTSAAAFNGHETHGAENTGTDQMESDPQSASTSSSGMASCGDVNSLGSVEESGESKAENKLRC